MAMISPMNRWWCWSWWGRWHWWSLIIYDHDDNRRDHDHVSILSNHDGHGDYVLIMRIVVIFLMTWRLVAIVSLLVSLGLAAELSAPLLATCPGRRDAMANGERPRNGGPEMERGTSVYDVFDIFILHSNVSSWLVARFAIAARNVQIFQNPWFEENSWFEVPVHYCGKKIWQTMFFKYCLTHAEAHCFFSQTLAQSTFCSG